MSDDSHDAAVPPPPSDDRLNEHSPSRDAPAAPPPPPPSGPPPPPPPSTAPTPTPSPPTPATSVPAHVKAGSSTAAPTTTSGSAPQSPGHATQTPHSKLVSHQPLDAADELDRKWYAHFYHMQKTINGKDEGATLAILKQQPPGVDKTGAVVPSQLTFQPDIALLYAIVTEPQLAKQYLRFLTSVASADNYKNVVGSMQKLIEQKFSRLLRPCRSQLLWLVRELVHLNVPGIDKVIVSLMRHLNGGDPTRTSVWLASSIVRILVEHEAWLLSCSTFIPYVFHTFARIVVDHSAHASLVQQEIDLCTMLWNRRQSDVAQLGREVVRVLNDAKDVPGMNALWKQLRAVRDESDHDTGVYSVSRLMVIPTPPKYLAYRLTPKMEEHLVFMMEKVQIGAVTRYQKWFASQFLVHPGSDALVPDLVRYICAVYHPSNQILGSKITPRYHILGWLYLLCKSPASLARVQLAMFFDYLYFKPNDNIMNVEPAMLLMVKSLKSHPQMTLAMIQFLVFAVEKFAASAANKVSMQKGVSTAFSMMLKVGVVSSIHVLQNFPLLLSSAPELKSELHRIFPEHFPSPETVQAQQPSPHHTPAAFSAGSSPLHSPNVLSSPVPSSPAHESPLRSPVGASGTGGSPAASPVHPQNSPSHSDSSMMSTVTSSDSLSTSSFLPNNQMTQDETNSEGTENSTLLTEATMVGSVGESKNEDVPPELLVLGHEEFKSFQEMMPDPCTRPTEGFLESLNDILISWIRQDNAQDLAAPLGSFLHASLEKMIVSSKISMSNVPMATCAGVFDSMLDQVLSEPQELYVPFLVSMHARDATIGFRILAFCCSRGDRKSIEATLAPYIAFIDGINCSLSQTIVKDITLTQHIDDARALAIALMDKSAPPSTPSVKDEVGAVDAAVLYILPYLFRNLEHPSLSKLLGRSEALIQLIVSLMTPATFQSISARIMLHEFSILKTRLPNTLVASMSWSSWEQYALWDLVIVETQATNSSAAVKSVMTAARRVIACLNPDEHTETLYGLLKCLILFTPDASMLQTIFKLDSSYIEFSLSVLSSWCDKCVDAVKSYIQVILQVGNETTREAEDIVHKLELLQRRRGSHTIPLLKDEAVLTALRSVVTGELYPTVASFVVAPSIPTAPPPPPPPPSQQPIPPPPASVPRSPLEDQPPMKKQRVDDEH